MLTSPSTPSVEFAIWPTEVSAQPDQGPAVETISVFDMLKIGVGPSSSHTLGPWRATQRFLHEQVGGQSVDRVQIDLYGSLALTGKGHHTDTAICLALLGHDPVTVPLDRIDADMRELRTRKTLRLNGASVDFDPAADIHFHKDHSLPEHPNGLRLQATSGKTTLTATYFSVGGGFVLMRGETSAGGQGVTLPYPAQSAAELREHCLHNQLSISQLTRKNEAAWRSSEELRQGLADIWSVMLATMFRGCHAQGSLPGGLHVRRRATGICRSLLGADYGQAQDPAAWLRCIQGSTPGFTHTLRWISTFALATNEENASLGRVVTAPTNGAAGVIPAVLMWHLCFNADARAPEHIEDFLLVAGEIGSHFKKGATISAAMGGCQAEIGVSSAMAAAALTEVSGGTVDQCLMAAEIAMEHHLGMTCDPVAGLVQIPCIERNTMGAVKAVNAAQIALVSDPAQARVSLDEVIRTMSQTAQDMSAKYKETSQGGLAVNIPVGLAEC